MGLIIWGNGYWNTLCLSCPKTVFMQKLTFRGLLLAFSLLITSASLAQESAEPPKDWFILDPETDHVQGVSAEKVYQTLLKGQPSRTVTVAIIDSGVDIKHEDLKGVVWINKGEIPDNGIDDDKNGYIDDVHGWNFIGGKNGNVDADTYELTREYMRLKKKFENVNTTKLNKKDKAAYENFQKIEQKYKALKEKNEGQYNQYVTIFQNFSESVDTLKAVLKVDTLTAADLEGYQPTDLQLMFARDIVKSIMKAVGNDTSADEVVGMIGKDVQSLETIVKYGYNEEFNSREIVGDNYSDPYQKNYGNNDVIGPDPTHGTHVAGIIAGDRTNDIGIKGIADNVRIMSVRAVPNGDERDKDVANAIIYAVDNGANVINMSFGKGFSPEKEAVDKAVKYAEKKGVLLIHAAGNDGDNNDVEPNYPNRYYLDGKEAKNWLEIGASSWGSDANFVASFSNYGKKSVDLFAPGVQIYSTTPNNTYENLQGTSMAAPAVTGVAAILFSYFPDLSYAEVKDVIRKSVRHFDGLKVTQPNGKNQVTLSDLVNTGGLVNAYEAVKLAKTYKVMKTK